MPPEVLRARQARREMSYPEVLLWQRLRGSPGGLRFRRQHPIGPDYRADFYCSAAKLVIEVDGAIHDGEAAAAGDALRDVYMASRGLQVVRIPARDVLAGADEVAAAIVLFASAPLHHRASRDGPPPRSGEER